MSKNYFSHGVDGQGYAGWGSLKVHRLLAIAEGEAPHTVFDGNHVIHHKNGIPWDNRPDNIQCMTRGEHKRHHMKEWYGSEPWQKKETLEEMYVDESMSGSEIADELGCTPACIYTNLRKHNIPTRNNQGLEDWEEEE